MGHHSLRRSSKLLVQRRLRSGISFAHLDGPEASRRPLHTWGGDERLGRAETDAAPKLLLTLLFSRHCYRCSAFYPSKAAKGSMPYGQFICVSCLHAVPCVLNVSGEALILGIGFCQRFSVIIRQDPRFSRHFDGCRARYMKWQHGEPLTMLRTLID